MLRTIEFIFIFFIGISLIVIALLFNGIEIDNIIYKNILIKKLYLKYDKKLNISASQILIEKATELQLVFPDKVTDAFLQKMIAAKEKELEYVVTTIVFYDKMDNVQNSFGDLSGRATIDGTTGALEIPQTRVSDDHVYTCRFHTTASGNIQNKTQLVITGKS